MTNESEEKNAKIFSFRGTVLLLGFFTLLSRLVGWLRDSALAGIFGGNEVSDAFFTAFRIPDFLFNFFILGTLTVAFLPVFNRELVKNKNSASALASSVLTISFVVMFFISALFFILTPLLLKIIAPGFVGEQRELTIILTRILLVSPIIFTASNVAAVILQSYNKFLPTAVAPIIYNFGIICGALFFYPRLGPVGLVLGVLLGAFVHFLINALPLRSLPLKIRPSFNYKLDSLKEVKRLYLPRLLAFDQIQISLLVGTVIGSLLATGSISVFNFAENIQAAPLGIFALSFAVAAFPHLSKTWAKGDKEHFKETIVRTSLQILFYVVPVSIFVFIMRAQIVRIILGHGRFDWQDTILTSQTLGILVLSLFAQSLIPLLARAFYATHNTLVPVIISLTTLALNAGLAIPFSKIWGVVGIGAATSLAAIINFILLSAYLRLRVGAIGGAFILERTLKILIATIFAATAAYAALYAVDPVINTATTLGLILQLAIASLLGVIIYLTMGLLLNLKEAKTFVDTIKFWLTRASRPISAISIPPQS